MPKKETIRFVLLLTAATITIAIIILIFSWLCYLIPIDFPGTVGEWITALSTLSAGALTLIGVWWTISSQNEINRGKEMNEQKAYLGIKKINLDPSHINCKLSIKPSIVLKNTGKTTLFSPMDLGAYYKSDMPGIDICIASEYGGNFADSSFIDPHDEVEIFYPKMEIENFKNESYLYMLIGYQNIYDQMEYICFKITVHKLLADIKVKNIDTLSSSEIISILHNFKHLDSTIKEDIQIKLKHSMH
ncbi:hypothetical protein [Candidatus Stoquefichus massiliensis]|uniref:hypothetical protein n=1 Tax=Candidatus Stoquefichus massiliensis TaxID=1470350 RepID=UPI000481B610|nr:hypothetical protein [Candidatus Stoquefichus massiliensis]